ncbi:MAG: site-specific integrase [Candidatus Aenigmatarchaeota archaeon]
MSLNTARSLEKDIERIKNFSICEENKQLIFKFFNLLNANGFRKATLRNVLWALSTIAKILNKPFTEATKEDIIAVVSEVENRYGSEKSKTAIKCELKRFYKWLKNSKTYPEEVEWIKLNHKLKNKFLPEEILTKEEIERMAKVANNLRDKALVLVLYESGCRVGELLSLKIKNIIFDEYGCVLIVDGKTGMRRVRIIEYVKELENWLDVHSLRNDPEAYVWISLGKNKRGLITYVQVESILKKLAEKVGIKKRVNPHAFRHARATHLAKHLPEAVMKEIFGWTKDSKMASVYYHLSGKEIDEKLLEVMNKEVKKCFKCGEVNPSSFSFCKRCGSPLDIKMILEAEKVRKDFDDFVKDFLLVLANRDESVKEVFRQMVKERGLEYLFEE